MGYEQENERCPDWHSHYENAADVLFPPHLRGDGDWQPTNDEDQAILAATHVEYMECEGHDVSQPGLEPREGRPIIAAFTQAEADEIREILTNVIAGHHNRLESAVLRGDQDFAHRCALSAKRTVGLRAVINRAEREAGEPDEQVYLVPEDDFDG